MFESTFQTPVLASAELADRLQVHVLADNRMLFEFASPMHGAVKVAVFDLSGRMVRDWSLLRVDGDSAQLTLPAKLSGMYIVRVLVDGELIQKRVAFR